MIIKTGTIKIIANKDTKFEYRTLDKVSDKGGKSATE
jgi:hypothetical protein